MNLYEPFQFLTTEECDEIIAYANSQTKKQGTFKNYNRYAGVRNNMIVWYKDSSKWQNWIDLFNTIDHKIDWIQTPQIAFYSPGEKYDWHVDQSPSQRTHQRLWTLTCELQSAPGGKIELKGIQHNNLHKGEAIIFPSTDQHRATSPTQGQRISLTIWAMTKNYHRVDKRTI